MSEINSQTVSCKNLIQAYHIIQEKISCSTDTYHRSLLEQVLQTSIDELIKSLRGISDNETFSDLQTYKTCFQRVFIDCAKVLSYAHDVIFDYNQLIYRSPLTGHGYNFARASDVIELVTGAPQNISLEFFATNTLPRINEISPKIVGISISSGFELVPAFTLARLVKENFGNDVFVVMGGNFLSRVEHRFRNSEPELKLFKAFWNWMDAYVYSKGDLALLKLVDCVLNNRDLNSVPNLVYKSCNGIIENGFTYGPGIDDLPQSDFGAVLEQKNFYFIPPQFLTVPIYTSIGCSYGKCTFCAIDKMSGNIHAGLEVRKRNGTKFLKNKNGNTFPFYRKIDKILKEIINIKEKYNVSYFSFNDETFDIDFALQFSEEVIKQNLTIYWQAFVRAEDKLTSPEVCHKLYQGGCRLLRIGFEYLYQDKLNQTHKGYHLKNQRKIADALNKAGIWIHAYFMISSEEDFINAKNFFQKNPEYYDLFHTLEFFSQVKDRHSLEIIRGLKNGEIDKAELDLEFPQFRIWYDLNPKAREFVKDIRKFTKEHFPIYSQLYEPCEVAYFPVLSCIHGLNHLKDMCKAAILQEIDYQRGQHESRAKI